MKHSKLAVEFTFAGFGFPRYIVNLPSGSIAKRLQDHKNRAGIGPLTVGYYHAPRPNDESERGFYLTDGDGCSFSLRWNWCDCVAGVGRGLQHTGWFTDEHGDSDKIRGLVFRLPKDRGFLAAWSTGEGMCGTVDYSTVYETEVNAAYAADSMAESAAEKERDYQEQERAEQEAKEQEEQEAREAVEQAARKAVAKALAKQKSTMVKFDVEVTDTFGGEANYCWVHRHVIEVKENAGRKTIIRAAKIAEGWTGLRCDTEGGVDEYTVRPRGLNQVMYIFYRDESTGQ